MDEDYIFGVFKLLVLHLNVPILLGIDSAHKIEVEEMEDLGIDKMFVGLLGVNFVNPADDPFNLRKLQIDEHLHLHIAIEEVAVVLLLLEDGVDEVQQIVDAHDVQIFTETDLLLQQDDQIQLLELLQSKESRHVPLLVGLRYLLLIVGVVDAHLVLVEIFYHVQTLHDSRDGDLKSAALEADESQIVVVPGEEALPLVEIVEADLFLIIFGLLEESITDLLRLDHSGNLFDDKQHHLGTAFVLVVPAVHHCPVMQQYDFLLLAGAIQTAECA